MSVAPPRARRSLLVPGLFTLIALAALLSLGTWQVERRAWKERLIDTIARRLSEPPVDPPRREDWPHLDIVEMEFRRVASVTRKDDLVQACGDIRDNGFGLCAVAAMKMYDEVSKAGNDVRSV